MIGDLVNCFRTECNLPFRKATHNMKYCSPECCRIETNRKIMEKYYEKAAIKNGVKRQCINCETILSRYNESKICSSCSHKNKTNSLTTTNAIMGSVAWL